MYCEFFNQECSECNMACALQVKPPEFLVCGKTLQESIEYSRELMYRTMPFHWYSLMKPSKTDKDALRKGEEGDDNGIAKEIQD